MTIDLVTETQCIIHGHTGYSVYPQGYDHTGDALDFLDAGDKDNGLPDPLCLLTGEEREDMQAEMLGNGDLGDEDFYPSPSDLLVAAEQALLSAQAEGAEGELEEVSGFISPDYTLYQHPEVMPALPDGPVVGRQRGSVINVSREKEKHRQFFVGIPICG